MVPEQILKLSIGSRIDVSGHRGTVKYVGEVINTKGDWLGIDWDDPGRGKHDGTHMNVQYFKARCPTSGSFIRPGKVNVGISIVEAIQKRYGLIEDINAGVDVLSMQQIQKEIKAKFFEVVGASKLNKQQSDFSNLQVILLGTEPVNGAGPPLALFRLCPKITELDLSHTLLSSWKNVAEITVQLKRLKILNLSDNRLELSKESLDEAFAPVEHLVLGRLDYSWEQVLTCAQYLRNIRIFQIPFNRIRSISPPPEHILARVTWLDLEGNCLRFWEEVNKLGSVPNLQFLNLATCELENISLPGTNSTPMFPSLRHLILNENRISYWVDISELDKLSSLVDLKFRENPILLKENVETNRQLIIIRIKNLKSLNCIEISPEERRGAEFDYLKRYGKDWLAIKTDDDRNLFNKLHPCYQRLVEKYGPPDVNELPKLPLSLKNQLIQIEIFSPDHQVRSYNKKIPYNMSVEKLAGLIQRLFNTGYKIPRLTCIHAKRTDNVEVPLDNNMKDLNYYSIESGDKISVRW